MRGKCPKGGKHVWQNSGTYTDQRNRIHEVVVCSKCGVRHDRVVGKA